MKSNYTGKEITTRKIINARFATILSGMMVGQNDFTKEDRAFLGDMINQNYELLSDEIMTYHLNEPHKKQGL